MRLSGRRGAERRAQKGKRSIPPEGLGETFRKKVGFQLALLKGWISKA